MKQPNNWNTPLKSVLKDLQSDKRRVENAALRELRRRFVGLDKKEQMMVLMHHLRRKILSRVGILTIIRHVGQFF